MGGFIGILGRFRGVLGVVWGSGAAAAPGEGEAAVGAAVMDVDFGAKNDNFGVLAFWDLGFLGSCRDFGGIWCIWGYLGGFYGGLRVRSCARRASGACGQCSSAWRFWGEKQRFWGFFEGFLGFFGGIWGFGGFWDFGGGIYRDFGAILGGFGGGFGVRSCSCTWRGGGGCRPTCRWGLG